MNRVCQICGKNFDGKLSHIKKGFAKYCSYACMGKARSIKYVGENSSRWEGGKVAAICQLCGQVFYKHRYRLEESKYKLCSKECWKKWASIHISGKNHHQYVESVKIICVECGKEFFKKPSYLKNGRKYCSNECRHIGRSKLTGDKSYNWRGGKSSAYHIVRTSKEYLLWRDTVFKRDKYTCQKCGDSRGGNLAAHHIKRFSFILDDIKQKFPLLSITDVSRSSKELWDISNGITLCVPCHKLEHKNKVCV